MNSSRLPSSDSSFLLPSLIEQAPSVSPHAGASGLLGVCKPCGVSSHQVIARMRRVLGIQRVGHGGTLDPFAAGILPVAVGRSTRCLEALVDAVKVYDLTLTLGTTTDTLDHTGKITGIAPVKDDFLSKLPFVLNDFMGSISQIPPTFSALKCGGVPLYRLARQGRDIDDLAAAKERIVFIQNIELLPQWPHHELTGDVPSIGDAPNDSRHVDLRVTCGKGTYIRSLCRDIAQALGTVGQCSRLVRVSVGSFSLNQSVHMNDFSVDQFYKNLRAVEDVLSHLPLVDIDCSQQKSALLNGRTLLLEGEKAHGLRGKEQVLARIDDALILCNAQNTASASNGQQGNDTCILLRAHKRLR